MKVVYLVLLFREEKPTFVNVERGIVDFFQQKMAHFLMAYGC